MANEIIPDSSPNPESALGYDGTDFRTLAVDTAGHTQVDIVTAAADSGLATEARLYTILTELWKKVERNDLSLEDVTKYLNVVVKVCALPTGAATSAKQDTMITALQLIDDLQGALASAGIDQLAVKGQDQLFSYKDRLLARVHVVADAATMILTSAAVATGEVWEVTHVSIRNEQHSIPSGTIGITPDEVVYHCFASGTTAAANGYFCFTGHMYLRTGDKVFANISGCTLNDDLYMDINGYRMTKET